MPAAVLLDLFDTVVASDWASWHGTFARLLGVDERVLAHAYTVTREARNTGRYPDEEGDVRAVIEAVGIEDPPADLVRSCTAEIYRFSREGIDLYDDVAPTVTALREAGVPTALVSNCDHVAVHVVDRLDLEDLFDAVLLSFAVEARKPDPAIYHAALDALGGADPADALFVDDQTRYCDGARALGIDTRLIVRPEAKPPEGVSVETNGHVVITDLSTIVP